MGKRVALYRLEGSIEHDDAYVSAATLKHQKLQRGRGSQRKTKVAVMAESTPL